MSTKYKLTVPLMIEQPCGLTRPGHAVRCDAPISELASRTRRDRGAPPREVDVKQPLRSPPPGAGELRELRGGLSAGSPDPGSGIREDGPGPGQDRSLGPPRSPEGPLGLPRGLRGPGVRDPGSATSSRGGFYINPSRRGPAVPAGDPGTVDPSGASRRLQTPRGAPAREIPPFPRKPLPGSYGGPSARG